MTTKSFELVDYCRMVPAEKVHLTTQRYDATLNYPPHTFEQKTKDVIFIGLCEPYREKCIYALLAAGIPVRIGGVGWERFVKKHRRFANLTYIGNRSFGEDYANALSSAWIGLGLLSKRVPELHTTRTLEIPASGTVLATERTIETEKLFSESAVVFFSAPSVLPQVIDAALQSLVDCSDAYNAESQIIGQGAFTYDRIVERSLRNVRYQI